MVFAIVRQPESHFAGGYVQGCYEGEASLDVCMPTPMPQMQERRAVPCRHWARGFCASGDHCSFSHSDPYCSSSMRGSVMVNGHPSDRVPTPEELRDQEMFIVVKSSEACKDFQAGKCTRGDKCKFAHVGPARKQIQCRDFLAGKCGRGEACKYRHGAWRPDMQEMQEERMDIMGCQPPLPMEVAPPMYRIVTAPSQPVPQPIRRIVRYVTTTNRMQPPPPPPVYGMQDSYPNQFINEEAYPNPQGWVEGEPGCPGPVGCWEAPAEPPVDMLRARLECMEAEAARLKAEADAAEAHAAALRANASTVVSPPRDSGCCSEGKSEDSAPTPPYTGEATSDASERSGSPSDDAVRYVRHDPYAL